MDEYIKQLQQLLALIEAKISAGQKLTPEEQQAYDALIGFTKEGTNLTGTSDFQNLSGAFAALADESTKKEFERLYGTGVVGPPPTTFTRAGTVMEAFQRRGQSVTDGPAMAALSEGLQGYLDAIARNRLQASLNAYQAMTPIRGQNIQAATAAGNLGGQPIQRYLQYALPQSLGAVTNERGQERTFRLGQDRLAFERERAAAEDAAGDRPPINIPTPGQDSMLTKLAPALIGLLGIGGVELIRQLMQNRSSKGSGSATERDEVNTYPGFVADPNAPERPPGDDATHPLGTYATPQERAQLNSALYGPRDYWDLDPAYQTPQQEPGATFVQPQWLSPLFTPSQEPGATIAQPEWLAPPDPMWTPADLSAPTAPEPPPMDLWSWYYANPILPTPELAVTQGPSSLPEYYPYEYMAPEPPLEPYSEPYYPYEYADPGPDPYSEPIYNDPYTDFSDYTTEYY